MSEKNSLAGYVALAGNPNCGKTALFNALTGGRQKVGNYPGVTVERKEGRCVSGSGTVLRILDLPGTYGLDAQTPDEAITRDVLLGLLPGEEIPHALIAVADAVHLERTLNFTLELKQLGIPMVLALNMMDLAESRGLDLDLDRLSSELGVAVIPTVATQGRGIAPLINAVNAVIDAASKTLRPENSDSKLVQPQRQWKKSSSAEVRARFEAVDRILAASTRKPARPNPWNDRIDRVVVHPVWGTLLLIFILGLMFQAIFAWAIPPQQWIQAGVGQAGDWVGRLLGDGALKSLLVNGVISGVGSVLVFLPQILLLFGFILILEDSGYMSRAAFLMDKTMGRAGLNGRAFIPLLSSFACAIPGIMATRTIADRRDRLITILIAPLTTCSARLPVYSLLIAAFIPDRRVLGFVHLQGLVMLGLYMMGVFAPLTMALVFRLTIFRGPKPPLLLELPTYRWPSPKNILLGLFERAKLFIGRAGTIILASSVVLWFLASYPKIDPSQLNGRPAIDLTYAGKLGHGLEPLLRPIGFNWRIAIALVPGFAAREVMISSLGTVYAVEMGGDSDKEGGRDALAKIIAHDWSLATGLSLIVWYILSCQCISTLAITRRETNSWRWPAFMFAYMTSLAYGASFVTFHLVSFLASSWGGTL